MAQIPSRDSFQVAPEGRTPYVDAAPVKQVAGAQLQDMGRAITSAGGAASTIFLDQLQETNALRVDEAITKAKQAQDHMTFDPTNGWSRLKGKDALERPDGKSLVEEYGSAYDDEIQAIGDGLGNDAQRRMFSRTANALSAGFRGSLEKHTASETVEYGKSVQIGKIGVLQRDMSLAYADPERTTRSVDAIRGAVAQLARYQGWSADETTLKTQAALSEGHSAALNSMIDSHDLDSAEEYLDKHKDDMTAADLFSATKVLTAERTGQVVNDVVNDNMAGLVGSGVGPQNFIPPVASGTRVTGAFGEQRPDHTHAGIDLATPVGTKVAASADGVVSFVGQKGSYGNLVIVKHADGYETRYAHLKGFGDIRAGQTVRQGAIVGVSGGERGGGGSGDSTGPHLHYEVRRDGVAIDPTGQHKANRGGMSLEQAILAVRSDPRIANNPRAVAQAESDVRSLYTAHKESERQGQQDAEDAAYKGLLSNGGDFTKLPASVRGALQGSSLPSLISFGKALQTKTEPQSGSALWAYTKDDIANGKIRDMSQLLRQRPYLSDADFKDLVGDVTARRKGDSGKIDSIKTAQEGYKYIETELRNIGIDITPDKNAKADDVERLGKFKGAYYAQVRAAEQQNGKPLTGDEARQIGLRLIATTNFTTPGGLIGTPKRGFELNNPSLPFDAIPVDVRNNISQELRASGITPTAARVRQVYAQRAYAK